MTPDYRILFTDGDMTEYIGHPLSEFSELEIIPRFNTPGSCIVTCEAHPWLVAVLETPGARAQILRNGLSEVAGPVETNNIKFDAAEDGEDGNGEVTFTFADDLAIVAGRLAYPNPAQDADSQTSARYVVTAINAETAMRALVNLNAGPGALSYREVPGLVLGAAAGVGSAINYSTRFEQLGDALRAMAIAGGGLGFGTVQVGLAAEFRVYAPRDLTTSIRIGRNLGNLTQVDYSRSSPTCTAAIVGGQDAGADRIIRERTNTAAIAAGWQRIERFIDRRDQADTDELDAAGDDALDDGEASIRLSAQVIDTASQQYRTDYGPGDIVSAQVFDGVLVAAIIRAVELRFTPDDGEIATPIIGTQDAIQGTAAAALQAALLRQQQQSAAAGEVPL